jgi:hypothetical protein
MQITPEQIQTITKIPKEFTLVLLLCGGILSYLILKEVFAYLKSRDKIEKAEKEKERPLCINNPCVTLAMDKTERIEEDTKELVKCAIAQATISGQMSETLRETKNILGRMTGIIGKKTDG